MRSACDIHRPTARLCQFPVQLAVRFAHHHLAGFEQKKVIDAKESRGVSANPQRPKTRTTSGRVHGAIEHNQRHALSFEFDKQFSCAVIRTVVADDNYIREACMMSNERFDDVGIVERLNYDRKPHGRCITTFADRVHMSRRGGPAASIRNFVQSLAIKRGIGRKLHRPAYRGDRGLPAAQAP